MRAAFYEKYGPPEMVQIRDIPKPTPKDNELLIKVIDTTLRARSSTHNKFASAQPAMRNGIRYREVVIKKPSSFFLVSFKR